MKPTDAFTIQAFTAVLPKLEMVLPQDLKQTIHATGDDLAQHHFSEAATTMRDLASRNRCLNSAYTPVYRKFQERYTHELARRSTVASEVSLDEVSLDTVEHQDASPASERAEHSPPEAESEDSESQGHRESRSLLSSLFPETLLERMTVPILTASDFVRPARTIIRQVKTQRERIPESMHLFVMTLQRAVATFDDQTNRVLRLLEHQLLTIEDIAHALNMPTEQAERIVQMLLKEGYIDSARSNLLGRAVAVFMPAPRSYPVEVNPATQFVLTSKGFFHLNPLLTGRHSEEELE